MNIRDEHLSGADLEALAAGQPPSSQNAAGHLAECTRCHDALSAMRAENRLFANEFAQENSEMNAAFNAAADANDREDFSRNYKPFVMYTVAASIMLGCALALIWYGKQQSDEIADRARQKQSQIGPAEKKIDDQPELVKEDDKPPKADENPKPGEEAVYEGKTAKQWAAQLRAGDQKAAHALAEIGRDALPSVLELMREPGGTDAKSREQNEQQVRSILWNMRLDKGDLTQFVTMLKDESFAVRRGAVELLGLLANQQPDQVADVQTALTQALKDRDRAVVEAARVELEDIKKVTDGKTAETLLAKARTAMEAKDFTTATTLLEQARPHLTQDVYDSFKHLLSQNIEAAEKRNHLQMLQDAVAKQIDLGNFDEAERALGEATKLLPNDPKSKLLLDKIVNGRQKQFDAIKAKKLAEDKVQADRIVRLQALENAVVEANNEYQTALKKDPFVQRDADAAKAKLEKAMADLNSVRKPAKTTTVGEGNPDF